ncbi:unnamed protein product [Cercopithifilaria johnstoni]|uniref:Uncharacterized protein n=1 Tax=Cercopithifilaria johnstoni TaxID=2874296 RepID=A0A8J2LU84_9BILA|nr:unnamed protein product [Cercopithifilaria johnstoni]
MLSGSGGTMNRFRVSSVSHLMDTNQKQEEQEPQQHSFQLNTQPQPNVQLNTTGEDLIFNRSRGEEEFEITILLS